MPTSQKAVWSTAKGRTRITCEIEQPGEQEVLIRNVFVASNPKDWKVPIWSGPDYATIEGNDVAGYIEAVGAGVTEFKEGDRVAAFTRMRSKPRYGAYQEYSIADAHCTFPLGSKTKFEDAATLPLAAMTAVIALFNKLELPEQAPQDHTPIVIHSAGGSVGSFALQLAKKAGYRVVATAGSSIDAVKSLGADVVVDYRGKSDEQLTEAISKAAPDARHALDAVSSKESVQLLSKAIQHGGKITVVLYDLLNDPLPNGVQGKQTSVGAVYSEDSYHDFGHRWYRQLAKWLDAGEFRANRVKLLPDGLASVDEGLKLLQDGKVSGDKLVYEIAKSPSEWA